MHSVSHFRAAVAVRCAAGVRGVTGAAVAAVAVAGSLALGGVAQAATATGHPNKGYQLTPPYGQASYVNENFPGSAQTQVTGIDDKGNTSGFWVTANGTNHGFVEWNGVFASF